MKHFTGFVREEFNKRSIKDRRKKVDWYLCEYDNETGIYRKSFEFAPGTSFETVKKSIPKIIE